MNVTELNYNEFTPMDMMYIVEELCSIYGSENVKTTLQSIIDCIDKFERKEK